MQSQQFVTMKLKVYARRFATFSFLLGSSIQCLFSVEIGSYVTHCAVCRDKGQMYLSVVESYFFVEVTHNSCIALKNNTSPKIFSVDFINFKY